MIYRKLIILNSLFIIPDNYSYKKGDHELPLLIMGFKMRRKKNRARRVPYQMSSRKDILNQNVSSCDRIFMLFLILIR